ncbi:hypothetical protein Tco_0579104 [Tanacetum coccineum]
MEGFREIRYLLTNSDDWSVAKIVMNVMGSEHKYLIKSLMNKYIPVGRSFSSTKCVKDKPIVKAYWHGFHQNTALTQSNCISVNGSGNGLEDIRPKEVYDLAFRQCDIGFISQNYAGGSNWRDAIRERTERTMFTPEEKLGHIRMATVRHDRSTAINSGTSTQYPGRVFACSTKEKRPGLRACESHPSGATPLSVSWTLTKVITRYRWQSQTKRKWLSTPTKGYIAKMPFGLKNTGATYQWLVDKAFVDPKPRSIP